MTEAPPSPRTVPPGGMRVFLHVLVNTAVANVTTSFLWFALTFWVYLETKSVLATGLIGGAYMLLLAIFGMVFGTLVDRFRKHSVMVFSGVFTLIAFLAAGAIYVSQPESAILDLGRPWFWLFSGIILAGAVVENLRNIALSTTVTLLVPTERHANANGLVGTVQGIAFIVTSALSGLAIGLVGMGWTLAVAIAFTAVPLVHLLFVRIAEDAPAPDPGSKILDIRGAAAAIRAVPGLFALILFSTFNNLIGGLYMALMDPYGLELFDVKVWGIVLAVTATGFLIGGGIVAAKGLGRNPIRTLLLAVAVMGLLGAVFTLREWWWLYGLGIWAYMTLVPVIESAEQTVIQKVVPFERQGRVFGAATALEVSTGPITSFAIAPIAEFWIIPYFRTEEGERAWSWLLGEGEMRGIALIFLVGGLLMVAAALAAFLTRSYRTLSAQYETAPETSEADAGPPATGIPSSSREAAGGVAGE
ncbi:MFS transporter [Microbacterium oleivorans]|uniref:MFS transporter n=1 Tax=Microbacterium oleivorans TaxID=273677 RepID=UPI0010A44394|nr:MFS transporter [Microbacterium oleivorans]THE06111.1 MFS transporter [Microbacterium oleivorans]